ncbi:MAG TPA: glycerate kinase [Propionicimonas sp.]|uniref:glycerate kinase n=1 Tax=Propionicimonas sp. TaxID=1955623 RepID=UPI002F401050
MTALRVAVVCGRVGDLDPVAAGTALARGIAPHAQVAVAPVAAGGPDLAAAVAALTGGEVGTSGQGWLVRWPGAVLIGYSQPAAPSWAPGATTRDVGEWIASGVGDARRVVLDLTGVTAHDGGEGLLAAAGAALAGRELVGLVAPDETSLPATGIGGGLARRAFAGRVDVAELLAADAVLAARAASLGDGLATAPGGGAAGGCGLAILAIGGELSTGTQFCHQLANLADTLARADLVVTGCTELSALDRGGPVVQAVVGWADEAERPCILFTTGAGLARRELRTLGLEAAHLLPAGAPTPDGLTATAARIAAGWVPGPRRP